MIPLNISSQNATGFTLLSNIFIDDYMLDANDAQIKVYLYLLRTLSDNISTNISEIADKFNHTEKDIIKSLKHWENKGVLSIIYDQNKEINSIILNNLNQQVQNISQNNVSVCTSNSIKDMTPYTLEVDTLVNTDNNYKEPITMIKMDYEKEINSYTADKISEFHNDNNIKMLLNTVPMYFGRMLSQTDIRSLIFIYDRLGFPYELIDCIVEQSAEIGKKDMHFIENMSIKMYEQGINTTSDAKTFIKNSDKYVKTVMEYFGKTGAITDLESKLISTWIYTYGFSMEIIKKACDKAIMYTDNNRLNYADKILNSWYKKNVRTLSDIEKLDAEFNQAKSEREKERAMRLENANINKQTRSQAKSSAFLNMESRDYDISEIEDQLLSN